jgi:quercetin dioxygenase-like cupin family protein
MALIVDCNQVEIKKGRFPGVSFQVLMGADTDSPQVQMAVLMLEPGATLPLHTHVDSEAFYILEGSGFLTVDGVDYSFQHQSAMLATPGIVHGFTNNGTDQLKILCMHPIGKPTTTFIE